MQVSMSTLTWLTFPSPGSGRPPIPYAAADLESLLDAAVVAGFTAVGLDNVALGDDLLSREGRARIVAVVAARELSVTDIGVLRIGTTDTREQASATAELAGLLGVRSCMGIVDAPLTDTVIDEVRACAEIIAGGGARLDLEFMAYGPVPAISDAVALSDTVGPSLLGIVVDSWHMMHGTPDWATLRALPAERIGLVQISDGARRVDDADEFFTASRWGRMPPGHGAFDFRPFRDALTHTGYSGPVAPEVLSYGARHSDAADCARILHESMSVIDPSTH